MARVEDAAFPWERQPKETEKAYEAFLVYKNLGPGRTFTAVAKKLHKSCTLVRRWATTWKWKERVELYDRENDRKAQREAQEAQKEMVRTHIKIGGALQKKALQALDKLDPEEMGPGSIKEFIRLGTQLERLNRNQQIQATEEKASDIASLFTSVLEKAWSDKEGKGTDGER